MTDRESWARAMEMERQHGERGSVYIAERIAALAISGDFEAAQEWQKISARFDLLRQFPAAGARGRRT